MNLEKFRLIFHKQQAREAATIVHEEEDWLSRVQPGTVERYQDEQHARYNIGRLAWSAWGGEFNPYIVRENKVAKGLATIILNQQVMHPSFGSVEGSDLDYWLVKDASEKLHLDTVMVLILEGHRLTINWQQHGRRPKIPPRLVHPSMLGSKKPNAHQLFATVPISHPNPPIGFSNWEAMEKVGGPAKLIPFGADKYDVARSGVLSQLYALNVDQLPLRKP